MIRHHICESKNVAREKEAEAQSSGQVGQRSYCDERQRGPTLRRGTGRTLAPTARPAGRAWETALSAVGRCVGFTIGLGVTRPPTAWGLFPDVREQLATTKHMRIAHTLCPNAEGQA
jgi:hypothetical protein